MRTTRSIVFVLTLLSALLLPRVPAGAICIRIYCPSPPAPCFGDGTTGYRIQVFYLYSIESNANVTQDERAILDDMAAEFTSLTRRALRFVCVSGEPSIIPLKVADGSFEAFQAAVPRAYKVGTRKLLAIGSNGALLRGETWTPRGVGAQDDRHDPKVNLNNVGPHYAVCSAQGNLCLHELTHALGVLNNSAPHATGAGHCWDDNGDVMCRSGDGGSRYPGEMGDACVDYKGPYYDCNGDDYYNDSPASGSYLASHWNVACSFWIEPYACR